MDLAEPEHGSRKAANNKEIARAQTVDHFKGYGADHYPKKTDNLAQLPPPGDFLALSVTLTQIWLVTAGALAFDLLR